MRRIDYFYAIVPQGEGYGGDECALIQGVLNEEFPEFEHTMTMRGFPLRGVNRVIVPDISRELGEAMLAAIRLQHPGLEIKGYSVDLRVKEASA